jgi:hypothetical protein
VVIAAAGLVFAIPASGFAAGTPVQWHTFRARGIGVRYPPGWFATAQPLTAVTAPQQILAVASYRFRPDIARADGCEPKEAFDRLPPTGAFIFGWESGEVSPLPPRRPKHFKLTGLGHHECLGVGPGYMLSFSDNGRAFTVEIAFGKRATSKTRASVLRILNSFTAKRV